ncbi:hypothetical protein GF362_07650 [Candidatus Dojkabacteria bacterium]|nr:hypothetical protein [Candidatus Dojkabacteria bacterium]
MEIPKNTEILFFSPHPDDEVLAAGAFLSELAKYNKITIVYVTNSPRGVQGEYSSKSKINIRQKEAKEACKVLGCDPYFLNLDDDLKKKKNEDKIIKIFKNYITDSDPSIIISLHKNEEHPTHKRVTELLIKSIGRILNTTIVYLGEAWTPMEQPDEIFYFDEELMKVKKEALRKHKSQIERTDWIDAIVSLNRYRAVTQTEARKGFGSNVSSNQVTYAEVFSLYREKIRD